MTRTLADMTPSERDDCVGRWATVPTERHLVIIWDVVDDTAWFLSHTSWNEVVRTDLGQITPRLDLPRAWTPSGDPVPGEWEDHPSAEHFHRWCARWEKKQDEVTL